MISASWNTSLPSSSLFTCPVMHKPTVKGNAVQIKKVVRELEKARRPLICAGGGVLLSEAEIAAQQLAVHLSGDADQGDAVRKGRGDARDHIGGTGAGGDGAHAGRTISPGCSRRLSTSPTPAGGALC